MEKINVDNKETNKNNSIIEAQSIINEINKYTETIDNANNAIVMAETELVDLLSDIEMIDAIME